MNSPSPEHAAHEHHRAMPHAADGSGKATGAQGTTGHAGHGARGAHHRHEGHSVTMFRDRFWITLLLSIPTLLWSGMVQHMVGFSAPAFESRTGEQGHWSSAASLSFHASLGRGAVADSLWQTQKGGLAVVDLNRCGLVTGVR